MRKLELIAAVVVLLVMTTACGDDSDPPDDAVAQPTVANVAYAHASRANRLDLFLPSGAVDPAPLVIYVHGGGFTLGDERLEHEKVDPLLDAGYAVASVDYRLALEAIAPAAIQDVKAAVRWLRANAAKYHLDPDRFAAWGESAGGNLVALLGTTGDQATALDDPALGNPGVSSAVQAVVDWYGLSDFLKLDAQAADPRNKCPKPKSYDQPKASVSIFVGAPIGQVPKLVEQVNPVHYIPTAKVLPPFSIAHGTADCEVPYLQSVLLADALSAAGDKPDLHLLDGGEHLDPRFLTDLLPSTIKWLDEVLSG